MGHLELFLFYSTSWWKQGTEPRTWKPVLYYHESTKNFGLVHVLSQVLKIVLVGLNYSALLEKHSLSLKLFYTTKDWNGYSFPKLYKRYLEDTAYTDMPATFLKDSIILRPAARGFLCYLRTIRHIKNWLNLLGITGEYEELTSSTRNQQKILIKIAGLVQIACLVEKLHCKTV